MKTKAFYFVGDGEADPTMEELERMRLGYDLTPLSISDPKPGEDAVYLIRSEDPGEWEEWIGDECVAAFSLYPN
jgi:hypothetical protein